jgi:hypothetical protein
MKQQILNHLNFLQTEIDKIKKALYLESDRYEVIAIHRDGFSFVGVNDHLGNGDKTIICTKEKLDKDLIKRAIQSYFKTLNPTHEGLVTVYSDFPREDLDENYEKFIDVMEMEWKAPDEEFVKLLRSEYVPKDNSREE